MTPLMIQQIKKKHIYEFTQKKHLRIYNLHKNNYFYYL